MTVLVSEELKPNYRFKAFCHVHFDILQLFVKLVVKVLSDCRLITFNFCYIC